MMKPITLNVRMTVETAAGHVSILIIVHFALVLAILLATECQMLLWEMVTVMMR